MKDTLNEPTDPYGIPVVDPPEGGPNAEEESMDPADLAPGFGGTSRTRPRSSGEESSGRA